MVIIIVAYSYNYYNTAKTLKLQSDTEKFSIITAQIWIASAQYRNDPERFIEYRDSLLEISDIKADEIKKYIDHYEKKSEEFYPFTTRVKKCVDSLYKIADSIRQINDTLTVDSTVVIDTIQ